MAIKFVTLEEIEYVAVRLAQETLSYNEPIPDHQTRFPKVLEHCCLTPIQCFGNKDLYAGLLGKASMFFYLMIKNHPFQNGNKRIAMTSLFLLLYKNDYWIAVDTQKLYNFTMWVAQSPSEAKDETVKAVKKFLKLYIVRSNKA